MFLAFVQICRGHQRVHSGVEGQPEVSEDQEGDSGEGTRQPAFVRPAGEFTCLVLLLLFFGNKFLGNGK